MTQATTIQAGAQVAADTVTMTYREAIRQALREEMRGDDRVFLIGEDIGVFGGSFKVTLGLLDEFGPRRVVSTPISESGILGLAVNAAATGLRPVAEIMFSDFFGVRMDMVVNQAAKCRYMFGAKMSVPLTIRTTMGGRRAAAAQHSQCLEAWFVHVPGLKLALPSNAVRREGPAQDRHPRPQPGHLLREQGPLQRAGRGAGRGVLRAVRPGADRPRRARTSRSSPSRTWSATR